MNAFRTSSIALGLLLVASPLSLANAAGAQDAASARQTESHAAATKVGHISKQQALKEIQLDGYTDVQDLRRSGNAWTAKAKEGNRQVSLLVDDRGNVEKTQPGSGASSMSGARHHARMSR